MKLLLTGLLALTLGLMLGFAVGRWVRWTPLDPYDTRLLGTWGSDAERTIEHLEQLKGQDRQKFKVLADLFGKMEVTYSRSVISVQMGSPMPDVPYRVVAVDDQSVVIQETSPPAAINDPIAAILSPSTFSVIHFDGPDSYWINTSSGFREYFKRRGS